MKRVCEKHQEAYEEKCRWCDEPQEGRGLHTVFDGINTKTLFEFFSPTSDFTVRIASCKCGVLRKSFYSGSDTTPLDTEYSGWRHTEIDCAPVVPHA